MFTAILLSTMITGHWFNKESEDKWAHMGVSAGLTQVSYVVCRKALEDSKLTCGLASALIAGSVGAAKEYIVDPKADMGDLLADGIGIGAGLSLMYTIEW